MKLTKINCRNCHYSFYQDNKETEGSEMRLTHKEGYQDKEVLFSAYTNEHAACPVCGGVIATKITKVVNVRIWNNELFRLSDHKEGDSYHDICDNAKEGDIWISGLGLRGVIITTFSDKDRNNGLNRSIYVQQTKKNSNEPNNQYRATCHIHSEMFGWDRSSLCKHRIGSF
jgi:hypothetical protein